MKQLTSFTIGFLAAMSVAIITNLPEYEAPGAVPDYGYNEPTYTIENVIGGWCAGRIVRRARTYEASYCAGEFGQIPINIPHTDSPEWDDVFETMMNEVDSLAGVK